MKNILEIFKHDLGISHLKKDDYFLNLIKSSKKELERKGILLDLTDINDIMLISDYTAYNYKNRNDNVELSNNLKLRIKNKIVERRGLYIEEKY